MTKSVMIQMVLFLVLLAGGQLLFKKTALSAPPLSTVEGLLSLILNPWFWAAIILYGVATLLWILILQKVSLAIAYPFVALEFVIIPVATYFLLGETVSLMYVGGIALILLGVGIIGIAGPR